MSKNGVGYTNSSLGGNSFSSSLAQNRALSRNAKHDRFFDQEDADDWYSQDPEGEQKALDAKMQSIADEAGNLGLGVGRAIGILAGVINGALIRFAEYIPTFPPVAGASATDAKKTKANNKKISFSDFFDKYAKDKVKVTSNGNSVSKEESDKMVEEFKKICKLAIDNGNSQLVKYFLKHIDGIDIETESFAMNQGKAREDALGKYDKSSNHIILYAKPGSMKYLIDIFLHEATHFVQFATRSTYSQRFMDECYEKIKSLSGKIENCIVKDEDCSGLDDYLEKVDYRGGCLEVHIKDLNQGELHRGVYNDKERLGELRDFAYEKNKVSKSLYKLTLRYTLDKDGQLIPVSKKDKMLYNMLCNLEQNVLAYEGAEEFSRKNAISDEVFQRGKEDFMTLIKENEKRKRGIKSSYSDISLMEINERLVKMDIASRLKYFYYVFAEREAYIVGATDSRVVKDMCGEPDFEWIDPDLARIYEIRNDNRFYVVTSDAKKYLEDFGITCNSPKVIPPYPGRVFDPRNNNKVMNSGSLDRPSFERLKSEKQRGARDDL